MITELILLAPLFVLYHYKLIRGEILLFVLLKYYWLPKCVFVKFLNAYFPSILTHRFSLNSDKTIALTFDDVPYGSQKEIVDLLDQYDMKGTLFIISDEVKKQNKKEELIDFVKRGHQLANHGKTNSMHVIKGMKTLEKEIEDCDDLIEEIYMEAKVERKGKFYRPGCGLFSQKMIDLVEQKEYNLTLGSVYPNDPVVMSSWINYYYLLWHIDEGDIVILHDRKWTVPMLKLLLPKLKDQGYTSVTLDNLF